MNETNEQFARLAATLDAVCAALQQFESSFHSRNAELGTRIDRIVAAVSAEDGGARNAPAERVSALEQKISELEARNSVLETQLKAAATSNSTGAAASSFSPALGEGMGPATQVALRAQAETALRKTLPPSMCALLAKSATTDIDAAGHFDAGALDKALASLSVDQRIAVKAEMARAGLIA